MSAQMMDVSGEIRRPSRHSHRKKSSSGKKSFLDICNYEPDSNIPYTLETMTEALKKFNSNIQIPPIDEKNFTEQNSVKGETYFVIHPVLKHIAILSCI